MSSNKCFIALKDKVDAENRESCPIMGYSRAQSSNPTTGIKTHCQLAMGILQRVYACTKSISVHVHKRKGCVHVNQMCNELLENGYVHA